MATGKLYIGSKVRALRETHRVTQAVFAERLGISTSYLNQIEKNQRPVSASVLLALAENFQIDISSFSTSDSDRLLSVLNEALADPLFDTYRPSVQEMKLITQNAPGFAHALIACHQAYRRNGEQLASIDDQLARTNAFSEPTPYEEVRDFFHFVDNYIHELDLAAEKLSQSLGIPERDAGSALAEYIGSRHGVRVLRAGADENVLRRFEPKLNALFLNPYSPMSTRTFQIAFQIAGLEMSDLMDSVIRRAEFHTPEAAEICRIGLQNYFAGALVLPYEAFLKAAKELRHDLELLASRFGSSFEQIAHRLSTLQRPGMKGTPVFFARIDRAGNITKRHSAAKLQFARYGAACPLWNAHQAFETPGHILRQLVETPDGVRYLSVATEIAKSMGGFNTRRPRFAIVLGCEISHASDFIYSDGLDMTGRSAFEPIGISCRICERANCLQRAVPPLKSRLSIDRDRRSVLPYSMN